MSNPENAANSTESDPFVRDAAREPEVLVRAAATAALSTIDRETGHPFASLVATAADLDGTPLLLLSGLARHTRNLAADSRASLLFTACPSGEDPLTAPRLTVTGRIRTTVRKNARRRYLARHPEAEGYAGFSDFAFYELEMTSAHLVAGFGRIATIPVDRLVREHPALGELAAVEAEVLAHMNDHHIDALAAFADAAGIPSRPVRMTGVDPWGCDLVCAGRGLRIVFRSPLNSAADIRAALIELTELARRP